MAKLIQRFGEEWKCLQRFHTTKLYRTSSSLNHSYHIFRNNERATSKTPVHPFANWQRQFCERKSYIHLMDFPQIIWPSIINTCRNWIFANLIITPYFDKDFSIQEFVRGAKMALVCVSNALAESDFDRLKELVTREALDELQPNISKMSVSQRLELRIKEEDIYFSFPYQIGIIISGENSQHQRRYVEITMCFHVLRGLQELSDNPPTNVIPSKSIADHYREKLQICNYRFIREYSKKDGEPIEDDSWTINVLNHFKPTEHS